MRVQIRYDTPDENDQTRRERNDNHGITSPEFIIPGGGEILWSWYFDVSSGVQRIADGVCLPIPAAEFMHWAQLTQTIVTAAEYAILRAMDVAFVAEMNVELQAFHERTRNN